MQIKDGTGLNICLAKCVKHFPINSGQYFGLFCRYGLNANACVVYIRHSLLFIYAITWNEFPKPPLYFIVTAILTPKIAPFHCSIGNKRDTRCKIRSSTQTTKQPPACLPTSSLYNCITRVAHSCFPYQYTLFVAACLCCWVRLE